MVTTERPAYYVADRFASYCGLSNDDKTTIDAKNADEFYEIDTSILYFFDKTTESWVAKIIHSWEYPIKSYDSLLISQAYSVIQNEDTLLIE